MYNGGDASLSRIAFMMSLRHDHRRRHSDLGYVVHDKAQRIIDIGESKHGSFDGALKLDGSTPHIPRPTCGTWLAQKGVPLFQVGGLARSLRQPHY